MAHGAQRQRTNQATQIVGHPGAPRGPWTADVDYLEATARQYDEDKSEANRNAFLWAFLRNDMDAGCVVEGTQRLIGKRECQSQ